MKKKRFGLLLSFVGAAALLGQLSIGALPAGPAIDGTAPAAGAVLDPLILSEDISKREEGVKHFLTEDGSYVAAIYGEPVHYRDSDGRWAEIDNTLSAVRLSGAVISSLASTPLAALSAEAAATSSAADIPYWENTANSFKVRLPGRLQTAAPVMVTHQGYTLGFRLQNTDAAQAALPPVSQPSSITEPAQTAAKPASAEAVELQRQTAMTVTGKEAAVSYEEAMPSVDVQYALSGQRLKESLVFDSQPARSSFTFVLNHPGLVPVLQDSGAVHFYAEQEEEPVFILTAPYMFDAADEMCMDVAVSLVPAGNGSLYTLTPDGGWLADPSRVYPVTLDPTVTTSTSASAIEDAGVNESNPTTNYYDVDRIYVGSNWTGSVAQESRMYVCLPRCTSIGTSDFILKATLYLQHYPVASWQTASNKVFDLYDAGSNNWDSASITWNSQKSYTFGSLIASFTSDKSKTSEAWNITTLARQWYKTSGANNGFVIKPRSKDTSKTNRTCYVSSDTGSANQASRPKATIEYYVGSANSSIVSGQLSSLQNLYSSKYLHSSGSVSSFPSQKTFNGASSQQWRLHYMGGGLYRISPENNASLCLSVLNDADAENQSVVLSYYNGGKGQLFRVYSNDANHSSYRLMPLCSGTRVLSLESLSSADTVNIVLKAWNSSVPTMKWAVDRAYVKGVDYKHHPPTGTSAGYHSKSIRIGLYEDRTALQKLGIYTSMESDVLAAMDGWNQQAGTDLQKDNTSTCMINIGVFDKSNNYTALGDYDVKEKNNGRATVFSIRIHADNIIKYCQDHSLTAAQRQVVFRNVIAHELGHALGLDDDPNGAPSIMKQSDRWRSYLPEEADVYGVRAYFGY